MQEIAQKCSLDLDSIGVGGVLATDVCAGLLECGIFLPGCSHGVGLQPWWKKGLRTRNSQEPGGSRACADGEMWGWTEARVGQWRVTDFVRRADFWCR